MTEPRPRIPLYIFGWPSNLGGADTKLAHMVVLLQHDCDIVVCPNDPRWLTDLRWVKFLHDHGAKTVSFDELPPKLHGIGFAMANERFFPDRIAHRAHERGLKILWSNEMMWNFEGELEAIAEEIVHKVLYLSEFQRRALEPAYKGIPGEVVGNYIDAAWFPYAERRNETFTIGRLSRAVAEKYPEDFPVFYERLELPDTRFRIMAWSRDLGHKYRWHQFDRRWDLLAAEQETQIDFLHSLDLFVYPLGHRFGETWGRSTVEAMLTGCIPLVPEGHHFAQLVRHGETGYICGDFLEWKEYALKLRMDREFRDQMSRNCREHAETRLCNPAGHRALWLNLFSSLLSSPS